MDGPDSKYQVVSKRLTKFQNNLASFTRDKRAWGSDPARFIENNNLKTLSIIRGGQYRVQSIGTLSKLIPKYQYQLKITLPLFEVELIYFSLQNIP